MALLTIAQFDNGACIVQVVYNDLTGRILAAGAIILRGTLTLTIERQGGQSRSFTLGPGVHENTNVPASLDMGTDPETGAMTITRGNAIVSLRWAE